MNKLAKFVYSTLNKSCHVFETELSGLEKLAWTDLQTLFDNSPQDAFEKLKMYIPPAEWPTQDFFG